MWDGLRGRALALRTWRVWVLDTENMEAFPARETCPLKRKEKGEAPRKGGGTVVPADPWGAVRADQEGSMFFWGKVRAGRCPDLCSCNSFHLKRCLGPPLFIFQLSSEMSFLRGQFQNC